VTRSPRTIAIGDIHGHSVALVALLAAVEPQPCDTLIFLGDYVDRGPDSCGVLNQLIELSKRFQVVALMGNHEESMLGAREGQSDLNFWLTPTCGGMTTLQSYGPAEDLSLVPREHFRFLGGLQRYWETDTHFFIHANYAPNWPLDQHDSRTAFWLELNNLPGPHYSGKIAIVGHTPQKNGKILDLGYLKCIDTGCGFGGLLTAFDVGSGQSWQVDERGQIVTED
jgi:serine/threonine protein phosphatase 1